MKKPKRKDFLFVLQSNEVKQSKTKTELAVEGEIDETRKKNFEKGKSNTFGLEIGEETVSCLFVWFVRSFKLLTLIVLIDDDHSTVTKTVACRCVRAHDVGAFDILRNRCRHIHGLMCANEL